jgi:hypothetical protein
MTYLISSVWQAVITQSSEVSRRPRAGLKAKAGFLLLSSLYSSRFGIF